MIRSKKLSNKKIKSKNKSIKNKSKKFSKKKMRGGNMSKKTEAIEDIRMKSGKKKKGNIKKIIEIKELMDTMKEQMLLQMKTFEKINLILGDYFTN